MISRRDFIKWSAAAGMWIYVGGMTGCTQGAVEGGKSGKSVVRPLDPADIEQFATPLLIPPVMPRAAGLTDGAIDYYEISMRQLEQQVLPSSLPKTTVWGYGPVKAMASGALMIHNAPSLTIEARAGVPTRVKWINELKDADGKFLPHPLPVDPTLHWANPPGGAEKRDSRPKFGQTPEPYTGPVPIVTHVHGAVRVGDESDGYAEAWFLPDATNLPEGYAQNGTWYEFFAAKAKEKFGVTWGKGFSISQYPNSNRASTIWYHDHALGMTRLNVYMGPAGFYIVRGGEAGDENVTDSRTGRQAVLPGPAPREGDAFPPNKPYYEIPIAIQDRAFNDDGSLFYPSSRDFFDGITGPFIPEAEGFSPYWNPEYFGNTITVNGNTWPYLEVEQRRYRFRFLNGCQARFLILDFAQIPGVRVWQIGNEGGLLPKPVDMTATGNRVLLALAERADVIVDFADVEVGDHVLGNLGPDEPFGGGEPGKDFEASEATTTGRVLQFRVVEAKSKDDTTPPQYLRFPAIARLPRESKTRRLALVEIMGMGHDQSGKEIEGPAEAALGIVDENGAAKSLEWMDEVTEDPAPGSTELWEIYNTTADAHPIHIHETVFEVVNRQVLETEGEGEDAELAIPLEPTDEPRAPEPWEAGFKDTVIAYPGEVTRVRATFGEGGQFTWHCHILEHEDNEMMRPYRIGPKQVGQPVQKPPHAETQAPGM